MANDTQREKEKWKEKKKNDGTETSLLEQQHKQ